MLVDLDSEVVHVFSCEEVESFLAHLVSNRETLCGTDHHGVAICVVIHDILQHRHQRLRIHPIKVNKLYSRHLYPLVTFDEINVATQV